VSILARKPNGEPLLYEVCSLWVQLAPLVAEDETRFLNAGHLLASWFGDELRWERDTFGAWRRASTSIVETLGKLPLFLDTESVFLRTPPLQMASTRAGFGMRWKGGAEPTLASPWQCTIAAHVPGAPKRRTPFTTWSFLHLTFPLDLMKPDELRARFLDLVGVLRVQWANAGLGLSEIHREPYASVAAASSVARRRPGLDFTHLAGFDWHDRVRSVSWLTAIGPALRARVKDSLDGEEGVRSSVVADAQVYVAGDAPRRGDMNRLDVPAAYRLVDESVRAVRARRAGFGGTWDEDEAGRWLRRFERSIV
jgi:hypothetical protein